MIGYKYHGCGNSFVVFNYEDVKTRDFSQLAIEACSASVGIGADGLIIVKDNPLEMIFYNQDGSRAPMCGNGIRCFADYVRKEKIRIADTFDVETLGGLMKVECINNEYRINMGKPLFDRNLLKINEDIDIENIEIDNNIIHSVFMGTIHSVVFCDHIDYEQVLSEGAKLCNHPLFTEKTNVNFVEIIDRDNIKVLTYERGVGITKACGTGCCASFVYANRFNKVNDEVKVHLELGVLTISKNEENIMMQGPATRVAKLEMED